MDEPGQRAVDSGTRGAYYIDALESRSESYIGFHPGAPLPPTPPEPPAEIFYDGFESGDLSLWDDSEIDDVGLTVTTTAALSGAYGLQAEVDDQNGIYVEDWKPYDDGHYYLSFQVDPNSIVTAGNNKIPIFRGLDHSGRKAVQVQMWRHDGQHQVRVMALDDEGTTWQSSSWVTITVGISNTIELDWYAASGVDANDGSLNAWLNGNNFANITGIDNDSRRIDFAQFGAIAFIAPNTLGTFYLDEYDSRRVSGRGESAGAGGGGGAMAPTQATPGESKGPDDLQDYWMRMHFDPQAFPIAKGEEVVLFRGLDANDESAIKAMLRHSSKGYQVQAGAPDDRDKWRATSAWITVEPGKNTLELQWQAASSAGAQDGQLALWVNQALAADFRRIDNFTRQVDYVRIEAGSYGAYYARTHRGEGEGLPPSPVFFGEDEAGIDDLWSVPFLDALPGILAQVDREQENAYVWPLLPGMKSMRSQSEEGPVGTTVISYTYDPLNRLKTADYSTGAYFHYTYDAVGNRLSKETYGGVVTTYEYDAANRLSVVDDGIGAPQEYSWDDNGNLLSDGVSTYGYNKANRLVSVTSSEYSVSYGYNGLGDRMQQTVDGVTTGYTLDIAAGLTQVLVDDSQTYFYGMGRIGQQGGGSACFVLGDAASASLRTGLGSVRQLVDGGGDVTLAKDYRPYGEVGGSWGSGSSVYGFAGEYTSQGLIDLRSRFYDPAMGRFLTRDTWAGDSRVPISYNRWVYSFANPINYTDPSGFAPINPPAPPNHRDLTYWLYEELSTNANGYYAQRINSLLNSSDPINKARAILGWIYLVKDRAKWDFKHRILATMPERVSILLRDSGGYDWYEYSVPGNIHFGFVGRAVGFSGFAIHSGAGYAEIRDPVHKDEACCPKFCKDLVDDPLINLSVCVPLGCFYINPNWASTLFDEPGDYWNVEFGIRLYNAYGSNMKYEEFQRYLAANGGWLTDSPFIPQWEWEHPNWPYPAGYFDGPDTGKNKSIVNLLLWRSPLGD